MARQAPRRAQARAVLPAPRAPGHPARPRTAARPGRVDHHEADLAGLGLLVDAHQLQVALGAEAGPTHRQARALRSAPSGAARRRRRPAQPLRQLRRHHHAAAHGLAVQPLAVAQARLDRVAEGVAEIEDGAQARLRARPGRPPSALISQLRRTACASAARSRAQQRVDVAPRSSRGTPCRRSART